MRQCGHGRKGDSVVDGEKYCVNYSTHEHKDATRIRGHLPTFHYLPVFLSTDKLKMLSFTTRNQHALPPSALSRKIFMVQYRSEVEPRRYRSMTKKGVCQGVTVIKSGGKKTPTN